MHHCDQEGCERSSFTTYIIDSLFYGEITQEIRASFPLYLLPSKLQTKQNDDEYDDYDFRY